MHCNPRKPWSQQVTDGLRQVKVTNTNHSIKCLQNGNDLQIRESLKQQSVATHKGYGNFRQITESNNAIGSDNQGQKKLNEN